MKSTSTTCVPALTAPGAVGGDAHLAAVVQVRAVHVQLQLLPFMLPQHGEEILILFKGTWSAQCNFDFDFKISADMRFKSPVLRW